MPFLLILRSTERIDIDLPETSSLAERNAQAESLIPEGFQIEEIGEKTVRARSTQMREITVDELEERHKYVPEGWQINTIR